MTSSQQRVKRRLGKFREAAQVRWAIASTGLEFTGGALKKLPTFYPNSYNYWNFPELTYRSANVFPSQIERLFEVLHPKLRGVQALDLKIQRDNASLFLANLFESHGSDKALHGYQYIYSALLSELVEQKDKDDVRLLEIGLGTNNPSLISTMGTGGSPGASLRAFRDWSPVMRVFGADVDQSILFSDEHIRTAYVDQLQPETFHQMCSSLDCESFDVVIDDGLHNPEANLNTLVWALASVRPGGFIIIEDIPERTTSIWRLVSRLLASSGTPSLLFRADTSHMFIVRTAVAETREVMVS